MLQHTQTGMEFHRNLLIAIFALVIALYVVECDQKAAGCMKLQGGEDKFHLVGEKFHYFNQNEEECVLEDYKLNPRLKEKNKIVMTIGDSLDNYACEDLMKWADGKRITEFVHNASFFAPNGAHLHVLNCTKVEQLTYLFFRLNGVLMQHNMLNPTNFSEFQVNKDLVGHFHRLESSLKAVHSLPTHISFGSYAWDIQAEHRGYCGSLKIDHATLSDVNHPHCVCNATLRDARLCKYSSTENFQSYEFPWCTKQSQAAWEVAYIEVLKGLSLSFPNSIIFIRTQPPAYRTEDGNVFCQNGRNDFLRRLKFLKVVPNLKILDYDELFHSEGELRVLYATYMLLCDCSVPLYIVYLYSICNSHHSV